MKMSKAPLVSLFVLACGTIHAGQRGYRLEYHRLNNNRYEWRAVSRSVLYLFHLLEPRYV
jgi:hypothetical protein